MTVVLDLAAGEMRVADAVVAEVHDASHVAVGAVRLSTGAVVVPVAFGERMQLCALHRGREVLGAALAAAALRGGTAGDADEIQEVLALHLAGARARSDRAGFADVAVTMRHVFGWDAAGLLAAPAHLVDELAASAAGPADDGTGGPADDGWVSFELRDVGRPGGSATSDAAAPRSRLAEVREFLVDDLLRRGAAPLSAAARGAVGDAETAAAAAGSAPSDDAPRPVLTDRAFPSARVAPDETRALPPTVVERHPASDHDRPGTAAPSGAASPPPVAAEPAGGTLSQHEDRAAEPLAAGHQPGSVPPTAPASGDRGWPDNAGAATSAGGPWTVHEDGPSPRRPDRGDGESSGHRDEPRFDRIAAHEPFGRRAWLGSHRAAGERAPIDEPVPALVLRRHRAPRPTIGPPSPVDDRASTVGGATPLAHPDTADLADDLAAALDDEADLRGLLRW